MIFLEFLSNYTVCGWLGSFASQLSRHAGEIFLESFMLPLWIIAWKASDAEWEKVPVKFKRNSIHQFVNFFTRVAVSRSFSFERSHNVIDTRLQNRTMLFNESITLIKLKRCWRDECNFLIKTRDASLTDKNRSGIVLGSIGAECLTRLWLLYVIIAGGDVVEVTHRSERVGSAGKQYSWCCHRQHSNVVLTRFLRSD